MSTQTQPGTSVATSPKATSPSRWPRDLGDLFAGWPFAGAGWPFGAVEVPTGASIKLEEFVDDDQMVVKAELPGIDPEKDVEITVDDGVLTISAQRRSDKSEKSDKGYRTEFHYGSLVRQIRLPKGVSADAVSATYRDGVLEIRMPKPSEEPTARRVQIERS
jgi:HSP20 family protein